MLFDEPERRIELPKRRSRPLLSAERRVADYCSIRATMREVNRHLTLDDEIESMMPMHG
ncbi:hypothetical protein [Halopelagius longus]|uniref:Uncharacterized protein n=1 Tax=Halopelagius longus TaxID=1236180 RepID=A0A1H1GL31_9EURY|nr:hypothetical protein [Halopelagius longus]SDR13934.1 hypothetical protein SAMN05216278_3745 [Halopelagius longus]